MKEKKNEYENIQLASGYIFDSRKGSIISQSGQELFLEHRLKDFISILIQHKNDVVTRSELMDHVWGDVMVNDESITKAASDLRKFLSNNHIDGVQLITIRKLGYKLEISDLPNKPPFKINYLHLSVKIMGYAALVLFILIVLIRAAKY